MGKKRDEIIPYSENKNCFKINKEPIETLKRDEIIPYSESYKEPFKSFNINLGFIDKKKDEIIPCSKNKNYFKIHKEPFETLKRDEILIPYSVSKDFTKIYKEPFKGFIDKKRDERVVPYSESNDFTKIYEYKNYFKIYKEPVEPFKGFNNNLGKELAKNISSNLSGLNFSNYLDLKKSINTNLYSIRKSMKKINDSMGTLSKVSALYSIKLSEFSKNFNKLAEEMVRRFKNGVSVKDLVNDEYLALLLEVFSEDDEVKSYVYMKEDEVMTSISVRFGGKVHFVNFTDNPLDCAFGRNESPVGLSVFLDFLEERCIPKHRFNIDEVLEGLGLSEYNEVDIVEKTYGVLIDDSFWVKYSNDLITYEEALEKVGLGGLKKLGGTLDG